jgi:hypothetical protein
MTARAVRVHRNHESDFRNLIRGALAFGDAEQAVSIKSRGPADHTDQDDSD